MVYQVPTAFIGLVKVRSHAQNLNDRKVRCKRVNKDMVALGARCHLKCLTTFYRRIPARNAEDEDGVTETLNAMALEELVAYIESFRADPVEPLLLACLSFAACMPAAWKNLACMLKHEFILDVSGRNSSQLLMICVLLIKVKIKKSTLCSIPTAEPS